MVHNIIVIRPRHGHMLLSCLLSLMQAPHGRGSARVSLKQMGLISSSLPGCTALQTYFTFYFNLKLDTLNFILSYPLDLLDFLSSQSYHICVVSCHVQPHRKFDLTVRLPALTCFVFTTSCNVSDCQKIRLVVLVVGDSSSSSSIIVMMISIISSSGSSSGSGTGTNSHLL